MGSKKMHKTAVFLKGRLITIGSCALSALLLIAFRLSNDKASDPIDTSVQLNQALSSLLSDPSNNNGKINPTAISLAEPSAASLRKRRALSDAVNTMRCMMIPGCYPDVPCSDGQAPEKLPQGKTWEQHPFCVGDLTSASARAAKKDTKCLIYSFGVHDSTQWEERAAKEFDCEVFAFDPTSKFDDGKELAKGVTFHKLGLQGKDVDVSKTHSEMYDALDPDKIRTLGEIREMLGHEKRQVDVLRLDCEGCEWGVLKQLACSQDSEMVDQLMIEMHFQKNLGIATDEDLLIAADAITCLEEKRWGLSSMEFSGCDPLDAEYIKPMLKIMKQETMYMLLYATFRRMPMEERLYKNNDPEFHKKFTTREVYKMKSP